LAESLAGTDTDVAEAAMRAHVRYGIDTPHVNYRGISYDHKIVPRAG
jgi:hypothetical protein